jgi:glycerol-3-phosphate acyltransferase PlsY
MLAQAFVGESGACIAGVMCILGHCYPIYYKFKGGKGVATSIAVLLMMEPFSAAACILVFLVLVIGTRYISLGSVGAAFLAPVFVDSLYRYSHVIVEEVDGELVAKAIIPTPFQTVAIVIIALLVIFKHRANIKRLVNGEENKFSFKKSEK